MARTSIGLAVLAFVAIANAQAPQNGWGVQVQPQPQQQPQPVQRPVQQQPSQQFQPQQVQAQVQPQSQLSRDQQIQQAQQVQLQQQQQQAQLAAQQAQFQRPPQIQFQQEEQPQFRRPKVVKYNVQTRGDAAGDAAAVNRQSDSVRQAELWARLKSLNSQGKAPQTASDDDEQATSVDAPKPTRASKRPHQRNKAQSSERSQNQRQIDLLTGTPQPKKQQVGALPAGGFGANPFGPQGPLAGLSGLTGVGGGPSPFGGAPFGGGSFPSFSSPGAGVLPQSGGFGAGPVQGVGGPQGSGLVSALGALGSQLGRSLGLGGLLGQGGLGNLGNIGIPQRAPPVPGVPSVPGVGFPGLGQGQFDVMGIIGGISRRALNGSRLSDVLPPDRIQQFAENVTEILVPEMPDVDLPLYMGRWFEGIGSPRASSQRCVVHHYGGLTENGKTATFTALKIYREGNEFGQVQYSIGYAFRGGRQKSMLQMHSSETQDATPYWIYHIGPTGKDAFGHPQYEYAVVSNWIRYPVMVLVRDPDDFKKNYEVDVLRWLEDHGFINDFARTFNLIQPIDYSNCQYSDSTFAAFGK